MKYRNLGRTDVKVSEICLGTMTWGQQNSEKEACEQLDYAIDQGINFIDTAELYSIPPRSKTYGLTEQYIGNWLTKRGKRDDLIIASKIMGKSPMNWARPNKQPTDLTAAQVKYAVDESLKRLRTDYIDLYQVHWPSRTVNCFGRRFMPLEIDKQQGVPLLETLQALGELVTQGKVRHVGLSNETAWGIMEYLRLAKEHDLPRVVSVQNAYSLLVRVFEMSTSEVAAREDVGLLAYSPLAGGYLSGKYLNGAKPKGSRMTLFGERFSSRYHEQDMEACVQAYFDLAAKHDINPSQLAIAYTLRGNFVTSSIVGATSMEQLRIDIGAADVKLSDDLIKQILKIGERFRSPGC